jgi:hypothetical protein
MSGMQEKQEHTPGEWKSLHDDGVVSAYEKTGQHTSRIITIARGCSIANARLIAASPDLYEALDEAINYVAAHAALTKDASASAFLDKCTAALAKAKGGA